MASIIIKRNKFPTEFLQKVSAYLDLKDCHHCLFVCKFWYFTFQRALYKQIHLYSPIQLDQLFDSILKSTFNYGHLIKELHLGVLLNQEQFEFINHHCPLLEVIQFDTASDQLNNIDLESMTKWKQMRVCGAPILFQQLKKTLTVFGSKHLVKLHIQHDVDELDLLVNQLATISTLQDLTLEQLVTGNNNNNQQQNVNMSILSNQLEKVIHTLPRLKTLALIKQDQVLTQQQQQQQEEITLHDNNSLKPFKKPFFTIQSLSLQGQVNSLKWFEFITVNFPALTDLKLTQLSTSRFGTKWMWQQALVQLIQSLHNLKTLTLGGRNIPQLFSKALVKTFNNCSIQNLLIDFQTYQAIESCQFLLLIQKEGIQPLKYLRLRVWEQIPGWSGVTRNLFLCRQLITLELSLSKGLMDQFPITPFLVDQFLNHLSQLETLSLTGAHLQVTYHQLQDLDKGTFNLKNLELIQCKVENPLVVFQYLSECCPRLKEVVFKRCEGESKQRIENHLLNSFTLDVRQSQLEKLVLNSLLIYVGTIQCNEFIGIQVINSNGNKKKTIWCSVDKSMGTYIYPSYIISDDQEKNMELDEIYQSYQNKSRHLLDMMPGNYTPTLGFFTIYCRSVSCLHLDNLKLSLLL